MVYNATEEQQLRSVVHHTLSASQPFRAFTSGNDENPMRMVPKKFDETTRSAFALPFALVRFLVSPIAFALR